MCIVIHVHFAVSKEYPTFHSSVQKFLWLHQQQIFRRSTELDVFRNSEQKAQLPHAQHRPAESRHQYYLKVIVSALFPEILR